jgi:alcohol dehydrogenase (quinone), cytochrome c subunit
MKSPGLRKSRAVARSVQAGLLFLVFLLFLAWAVTVLQGSAGPPAPGPTAVPDALVQDALAERGKYLADAANCLSCHTREDGEPFAGGVAFETPLGTLYSTNITPDIDTGIGTWTPADLRRAMHEGVAPGGRRLYPAFPYPSYTQVTDEDFDAIYAFLRTIKPVTYTAPGNGILFSQRWTMRIWNALFFEPGRFDVDTGQSAEWNRGAYLVEGLGHCGACHTPRNLFMAEIRERAHQGGVMSDHAADGSSRRWFAVNLTSATNGLAAWSEDDLFRYLHTGFSRRAGTFGPMNKVIVNSLRHLSADDVRAMAGYIKSLPAGGEYEGDGVPSDLVDAGRPIYEEHCEKCHGESGRGGFFGGPPLAGSAIVQSDNPISLFNVVLHGPETPEEVSFGKWEDMTSYADTLSDEETAAVSNFVRGSWGNRARPVTEAEVSAQR